MFGNVRLAQTQQQSRWGAFFRHQRVYSVQVEGTALTISHQLRCIPSLRGRCCPGLVVAWKQPSKPINRRNVGEVSLSACVYVGKNSTEHHHPTKAVFGLNSGKIREDQSVKAFSTQDFKINLRGDSFFFLYLKNILSTSPHQRKILSIVQTVRFFIT